MSATQAPFVTDSREIQQLRQRDDLTIGPRERSDLLCTIMMGTARLEWWGRGDVGPRRHDGTPLDHQHVPAERLNARAGEIRPLLFVDSDALLRSAGCPLDPVAEWAAAFRSTGQALAHGFQRRASGSRAATSAQVRHARLARSIDAG